MFLALSRSKQLQTFLEKPVNVVGSRVLALGHRSSSF